MRILHTSDWHLGRSFHRVGLLDAQVTFLHHLADVVRSERVDAVVVAGDVYDRALPAVDAVEVLDDGLDGLLGAGAAVLVTSGNHDSAQRLGFGARRSARSGLHLRTGLRNATVPVMLEDRHGPVALYGIPYLEPALAADALGVERTHRHVLDAVMTGVRADLLRRRGARSVVASHAFVLGGRSSDSERDITVGGVAGVPASVFEGVDYAALGHLHGAQQVTETVRYSGSPLPYSFSERTQRKASWLVELGSDGVPRVEAVPAPVHRRLAALRGTLDELLTDRSLTEHEQSFCQVTLTDTQRPRAPMERLRARFPHTLALAFEPAGRAGAVLSYAERVHGLDDVELCCSFLEHVRGGGVTPAERTLLRQAMEAARVAAVETPSQPSLAGTPNVSGNALPDAREGAA